MKDGKFESFRERMEWLRFSEGALVGAAQRLGGAPHQAAEQAADIADAMVVQARKRSTKCHPPDLVLEELIRDTRAVVHELERRSIKTAGDFLALEKSTLDEINQRFERVLQRAEHDLSCYRGD